MKTEQKPTLGPEWITEGEGKWSKPLQFLPAGAGWVELMRLAPGVKLGLHRHTGHVHAINLEGSRQLGTGEQLGPHDYVYEPEGNVDWWQATGDTPLVVFVVVTGAVEYLAPNGSVLRRITVQDRRQDYLRHCATHRLLPVLLE
jgi:2,4'-dihydroxyacetophenone dioxygenase